MRIGFVVAVLFLLGAQTAPASAGVLAGMSLGMMVPCSEASSGPLPRNLCRDLAAVLLGPAAGLGLSVVEPMKQGAWTLAASALPRGALLPQIPIQRPAWRRHMEQVVSGYDQVLGRQGQIALPPVPAAFWPGGDPFRAHDVD